MASRSRAWVGLLLFPVLGLAQGPGPESPVDRHDLDSMGLTQGQFAFQALQKAGAERFFDKTLTPVRAAEALAGLGFVPVQGWKPGDDLTWLQMDSAYRTLLAALGLVERGRLPDLAVSLSLNNTAPRPGQTVLLDVTVANVGYAPADETVLAIQAPAGVTLSGTGDGGPDGAMWRLPQVAPGEVIRGRVSAVIPGASGDHMALRAAVVQTRQTDLRLANNVAAAGMILKGDGIPISDLQVRMVANNVVPSLGDIVVYSVVVSNRGPDSASAVRVTDRLPKELRFERASAGTYSNGVWELGALSAGAAARLDISTSISDSTNMVMIITNTVTVANAGEPDPNEADNADSVKIAVRLVEWLAEAVRRAFLPTTTERQPISPSRPLWR